MQSVKKIPICTLIFVCLFVSMKNLLYNKKKARQHRVVSLEGAHVMTRVHNNPKEIMISHVDKFLAYSNKMGAQLPVLYIPFTQKYCTICNWIMYRLSPETCCRNVLLSTSFLNNRKVCPTKHISDGTWRSVWQTNEGSTENAICGFYLCLEVRQGFLEVRHITQWKQNFTQENCFRPL